MTSSLRNCFCSLSLILLVSCTGGGPDISLPQNDGAGTTGDTGTTGNATDNGDTGTTGDATVGGDTGTTGNTNVGADNGANTIVDDPNPTNGDAVVDLTIIDVVIPRITNNIAPQIDGQVVDINNATNSLTGEWEAAIQRDANGDTLLINSLMVSDGVQQTEGLQHRWAALHDDVYLYLLIIVDDNGEYRFDTQEARKPWKDDGIELYFDGNNSKLSSFDGVDDFHVLIDLIDPVTSQGNTSYGDSSKVLQTENSATLPSDFLFAVGLQRGPLFDTRVFRADVYEVRIKLSELNISVGQPFGFEVQINDDDDGDTRDTKWGWHHPAGSDQAWESPSFLATAILQ